jgi:hypothetical protein
LRCWRGFGYDRLHLLARTPTTTETKLFGKPRSALGIAGCGHRMLTGEVPPHAVLLDAQSMAGRKMAFEHLAAPATIEADDIIAVN